MMRIAEGWASRGYIVALPDYYFRQQPGVIERTDAGRELAMARWAKLDVDRTIADTEHLKRRLLELPACNRAILSLGYCAGGELSFLTATRLSLDAIATFHATHIDRHLDEADPKARMTLHYGDNDSLVPTDQVDAIRARFAGNPRVDVHLHPGAEHGFSLENGPHYQEAAAKASDRRAEQVFREFLTAA